MRYPRALRSLAAVLAALAAPVLLAGCSSHGLKLGKVSGTVTYKGKPLENGMVLFMPDESKGTIGPPAVGTITSKGEFVMSTDTSGDGALVGSHKVGIIGLESKPVSEQSAPSPESNPEEFLEAKAKSSAASLSGRAKKQEDLFTNRSGLQFRYVLPAKLGKPTESGIITKVDSGTNTMNVVIDEGGNVQINP